jgi:hypothetical protein
MFHNDTESCEIVRNWMRPAFAETSDSRLSDFASFTLEGTWSHPIAVTLYPQQNPSLCEDGIRCVFPPGTRSEFASR